MSEPIERQNKFEESDLFYTWINFRLLTMTETSSLPFHNSRPICTCSEHNREPSTIPPFPLHGE